MKEALLQILYAFLGAYGFALLFNQKPVSRALPAAVGGAASWGIYLVCLHFGADAFLSAFAGGFVSCLYAEIMARVLKAPTTLFTIAAVIPLIPGGSLYYTMRCAITRDAASFATYGSSTLYTALGIAVGIAVVTAAVHMLFGSKKPKRAPKKLGEKN
ncbi:MAG: threonine/serine exporter family protein [Clostridia bacterium]|nr:threonine/serine exporter family protein [Clostridia bacterium]